MAESVQMLIIDYEGPQPGTTSPEGIQCTESPGNSVSQRNPGDSEAHSGQERQTIPFNAYEKLTRRARLSTSGKRAWYRQRYGAPDERTEANDLARMLREEAYAPRPRVFIGGVEI